MITQPRSFFVSMRISSDAITNRNARMKPGGKEGSIRLNQPDVKTSFSRCAILLTLTGRRALAPVF